MLKLVAALAAQLGAPQARLELAWITRESPSPAHTAASLARRIRGEPLQYILGSQPFGPLNLLTRPPVLIPRPETEQWTIRLAERLSITPSRRNSLLDLGTGSGCIPLLLCHLCHPGSIRAHGVDISIHAIHLAMENAALCDIPLPSPDNPLRNTFKATLASFLSPTFIDDAKLKPPFDVVTSNPPYIPWNEYLQLPPSVSDYEDPNALFGGPDGLKFYHAIARVLRLDGFLSSDAVVALEVGDGQAEAVEHIIRTSGLWRKTEIWTDLWGKRRTVFAQL